MIINLLRAHPETTRPGGVELNLHYLLKPVKLDFPIDVQCILFDKTVIPVLLYGSEVWGLLVYKHARIIS